MTRENFSDLVKKIASQDTSADPKNWTTIEQFGNKLPKLESEIRHRDRVLRYPDTQKRYSLLASRFKDLVNNNQTMGV